MIGNMLCPAIEDIQLKFDNSSYQGKPKAVAPASGARGARGWLPPNVEKDGPRNSSKFDEKIGRGGAYPSQMWKNHKY